MEGNKNPKRRIRNHPPVKVIIQGFLKDRPDGATVQEINEYVLDRASFTGKTPRDSIFSMLTRMDGVEKIASAKYKLSS